MVSKDNPSGSPVYRCVHGTNSIEGYHRHMKKFLSIFYGSPRLVHSVLLEFNYRWNVWMAIKNRGVLEDVDGFYHQYILDYIREITSTWTSVPLFPEWPSVRNFEDTLERFGFQKSKLAGEASLIEFGFSGGNDDRIPLATLMSSAEYFAKLRGFKIPITAVVTTEEKQKFNDEWSKYVTSGSSLKNEVRNKSINFANWAIDWNGFVDEIERGDKPMCAVRRKHANHLESYFKKYFDKSNALTTLHGIRHEDEQLRKDLRETNSNEYHLIVSEPSGPVQSPHSSLPRPLPSV